MDKLKANSQENLQYSELISTLQQILLLVHKAQKSTLRRAWFAGVSGETVPLPNVSPRTLYVDNTANANVITLRLDGDMGVWTIPASGTRYIPCEGAVTVDISGIGSCNILAINRDLFFGS